MQYLYEKYPVKMGLFFIILYTLVDVADARWFIPRMRDKCTGELTEKQEDTCFHWIIVKKNADGKD